MINRPVEVQYGNPFDYAHHRHLGSHLLRCCALCGGELEYCGETARVAHARESVGDPWSYGDCIPPPLANRDKQLDDDDHDRCQC